MKVSYAKRDRRFHVVVYCRLRGFGIARPLSWFGSSLVLVLHINEVRRWVYSPYRLSIMFLYRLVNLIHALGCRNVLLLLFFYQRLVVSWDRKLRARPCLFFYSRLRNKFIGRVTILSTFCAYVSDSLGDSKRVSVRRCMYSYVFHHFGNDVGLFLRRLYVFRPVVRKDCPTTYRRFGLTNSRTRVVTYNSNRNICSINSGNDSRLFNVHRSTAIGKAKFIVCHPRVSVPSYLKSGETAKVGT